ncbi:PREDICTED: MORN repeat-containing protein 3 isoform X2 [Myotis brandtii]|uniref:MORN repeat-containing protein 3 isoform X2 n=1 Tax=Myotis brandtii TaxID=109478 RepID=UPI00070423FA|nr:PREDICTED: MORN repeat-containing protein 3 isoform X2 [Myotis brandtii]
MHEGRENGRVEVGEREEGRKDRGLHKGGSRGTEGNGQPGEIFQYRMWGSARKEAAPVRGSGAWEDGGGRREQGHLRAFRAMGSSFSDPMSITKVSGVATSAAGGAACTTAMVTSSRANGGTTSRTGRACRLKNGNRYEGYWQGGLKNGPGRFFHLDHGQLFEGFWVDNIAKCGTMIDFGRDEAPAPTQFPIPQVKIVDPDGVLEEALAMFKKKEEPSDTGTRRSRGKTRRLMPGEGVGTPVTLYVGEAAPGVCFGGGFPCPFRFLPFKTHFTEDQSIPVLPKPSHLYPGLTGRNAAWRTFLPQPSTCPVGSSSPRSSCCGY